MNYWGGPSVPVHPRTMQGRKLMEGGHAASIKTHGKLYDVLRRSKEVKHCGLEFGAISKTFILKFELVQ